ncbi:two-component sensor histidine kinase [Pokkaliibacter plantistimulans]|uniref:histidine kinase n=1 Tax=Proteobacteria bacterium 228 TaxID=2083153 RepID=A0A2S5KS98_9PROT|nr:sensor histidine kinase [Pokkaliibacter plantistimulans]PPC77731.1 two-component sensor histidine kinase [Pokkaliibacter plantistimulans]
MSLQTAFEIMMVVTSGCALLVSGWLLWQSQRQRDLIALAGFGLMMALWCAGHVAIFHHLTALGVMLVLANPLMPTFFLDFAVRFVNRGVARQPWLDRLERSMGLIYALSMAVVLLSWWLQGGTAVAVASFHQFFVFSSSGWFNLAYSVLVGILAHGVLSWGFLTHQGNRRRSIVAMFVSGGWGLLLATSFVFPSLGLDTYPYPMLLLPSYVVVLVYGVVRYQILEVNAWVNRALLWVGMMLLILGVIALLGALAGQLGMQALANVPGWQLWLYSALVLVLAALLYQPLNTLVGRLVYPGLKLDQLLLDRWRNQLKTAQSWDDLGVVAQSLISHQLGQPVQVRFLGRYEPSPRSGNDPCIQCRQLGGAWEFELLDWSDITPALRLTGEVFGSLLASSCGVLERSLMLAEAERARLAEQHLVELGGLSAAMAHELRNPLNIIAMAAAGADAETRGHIQTQIKRADRLISDMLVYSGKLTLQRQPIQLQAMVQALLVHVDWHGVHHELAIAEGLEINADPHRVQQVLVNLIDNALAFIRNQADGCLRIEADAQGVIRLHNNGPTLPEELATTLFRPFVSKRPGGSGLGLAIVRRIMEAHGGYIRYRADLGWPVSFELFFAAPAAAQGDAADIPFIAAQESSS